MKDFICEVCGGADFYEFDYPTDVSSLKNKIFFGALRRYLINPVKFFARIIFSILPKSVLPEMQKRAGDPYRRIQPFHEVRATLQKIDQAANLFKTRKIVVCKNCDLGTVAPRISEQELMDYYTNDYWIMNLGELEPAESNRTKITYKLLQDHIGFETIKTVIEFGSASAHISRYLKSKEPQVIFDIVDPGIIWKDVLKKEIRDAYHDVNEITTTYDLLVSSHALEHISNLDEYFHKFKSLLNPGGYLYFEIPNSEERDVIFGPQPDFHLPHTYFYSQKAFEGIAAKYGFSLVFNKTFSRSYSERFAGEKKDVGSMEEHPKGAYLRVLLKKN